MYSAPSAGSPMLAGPGGQPQLPGGSRWAAWTSGTPPSPHLSQPVASPLCVPSSHADARLSPALTSSQPVPWPTASASKHTQHPPSLVSFPDSWGPSHKAQLQSRPHLGSKPPRVSLGPQALSAKPHCPTFSSQTHLTSASPTL